MVLLLMSIKISVQWFNILRKGLISKWIALPNSPFISYAAKISNSYGNVSYKVLCQILIIQ